VNNVVGVIDPPISLYRGDKNSITSQPQVFTSALPTRQLQFAREPDFLKD